MFRFVISFQISAELLYPSVYLSMYLSKYLLIFKFIYDRRFPISAELVQRPLLLHNFEIREIGNLKTHEIIINLKTHEIIINLEIDEIRNLKTQERLSIATRSVSQRCGS